MNRNPPPIVYVVASTVVCRASLRPTSSVRRCAAWLTPRRAADAVYCSCTCQS